MIQVLYVNEKGEDVCKSVEENEKQDNDIKKPLSYGWGVRHLQFMMLFFCNALTYAMRANLSVAIVQMTDIHIARPGDQVFDWDQTTIQLILSSFYWGYTINQLPGGYVSKRWGAKYTLFGAILASSILSIITPIVTTNFDWQGILAIRVLQGLFQGVIMPAVICMCAKWCPIDERGRGVVFQGSGLMFGTFVTFLASGQIAFKYGWPSIFYIFGGLGLVWCTVWLIFSASSPPESRYISKEEKEYIMTLSNCDNKTYVNVPWLAIFTSFPFYASVVQHIAQVWMITLLQTQIPTYLNSIFEVRIDENGLMSSLPYLGRFIMQFVFIGLEYLVVERQMMTLGVRRRVFHTFGSTIPTLIFIAIGFIPNGYVELAVTALVLANSFNAAIGMGGALNSIDMAPHHAGIIMGVSNSFGSIISIIAPNAVGWVVTDQKNLTQWRIIFLITAAITLIGNIVFVFLCSTDVQKWNEPVDKPGKQKTEEPIESQKKTDECEDSQINNCLATAVASDIN